MPVVVKLQDMLIVKIVDLVEDRQRFLVDLARNAKYVCAREDDSVTIASYFCWSAKCRFCEKSMAKDDPL